MWHFAPDRESQPSFIQIGVRKQNEFLNLFPGTAEAIPNTFAHYDNVSVTASNCVRDSTTLD